MDYDSADAYRGHSLCLRDSQCQADAAEQATRGAVHWLMPRAEKRYAVLALADVVEDVEPGRR